MNHSLSLTLSHHYDLFVQFSPWPYPSFLFVTVHALCPPHLGVSYSDVPFAFSAPLLPFTHGTPDRIHRVTHASSKMCKMLGSIGVGSGMGMSEGRVTSVATNS